MSKGSFLFMRECASLFILKRTINEISVPFVLLDENIENPHEFYITEITRENIRCGCVGVVSYGVGLHPEFIEYENFLFVGCNQQVSMIIFEPFGLSKSIDLETLFWKFIVVESISGVVVLCETALLLIGNKGDVMWRIDTDLITNYKVREKSMYITFSDSPSININLITGLSTLIQTNGEVIKNG